MQIEERWKLGNSVLSILDSIDLVTMFPAQPNFVIGRHGISLQWPFMRVLVAGKPTGKQ